MKREPESLPGRRGDREGRQRIATLSAPIAKALRVSALAEAPVRTGRPRVEAGVLIAGTAAALWDDAHAIAPVHAVAYAQEPMQVAHVAPCVEVRAHNDACVPLTHWVCDGLAELEAVAVLLGCVRLGELDAAIGDALDDWQTIGGDAAPRVPRLAPAIDAVLIELEALCAHGAAGDAAVALVAPIVELVEVMRLTDLDSAPAATPDSSIARASAELRAALAGYRGELTRLGEAIDRAAGITGDRIAVALGVAVRMCQVSTVAAAIATWIDRRGPATAAQARWRGAAAVIEHEFAGSLAALRQLIPLPP